jgi:hypothetical protein
MYSLLCALRLFRKPNQPFRLTTFLASPIFFQTLLLPLQLALPFAVAHFVLHAAHLDHRNASAHWPCPQLHSTISRAAGGCFASFSAISWSSAGVRTRMRWQFKQASFIFMRSAAAGPFWIR